MGVTNSNRELDVTQIDCGGSVRIKLSLAAAPDITTNPTDIVLILERSGSMAGSPLANLKAGANAFIDIIDESTDGTQDGQVGSGSRIAVVSFADTATQDTQLITSVADLKAAVNALSSGGSMAAYYIDSHPDDFKGLLLLGSYSSKDLSSLDIGVLSIYGSEDLVLNKRKYKEALSNLPAGFDEIIIEGGCHAYFGMYGQQDGDGNPTISNKDQILKTAQLVGQWAGTAEN